ncbi:MAG: YHS domain-containing protein [Gammaproteobacteria bacterium]|nr:YHS domain-containing protein [Gammaproteobacteria bacterium]
MDNLVVDPVCGMQVKPNHYSVEYLQVRYSFCSQQCQERFLANPHLYIGRPGMKAPKQTGLELVKRRRLRLDQPLSAIEEGKLIAALQPMMGIQSVEVSGDCIEINYDLLQATAAQIEEKMAEIGVQLGAGWTDRLRRAFVHYEEECEIGNLEVPPDKHTHRH